MACIITASTNELEQKMKVITLRNSKFLPKEYRDLNEFFVRIGGNITKCNNISEAQKATAFYPQECTVTLMTKHALEKYKMLAN